MSTATVTPDMASSEAALTATNMLYFLILPVVLLWYVYWRISRKHMVDLADKIPGPKTLPIVGNALEFIGSSPGIDCDAFLTYIFLLVKKSLKL